MFDSVVRTLVNMRRIPKLKKNPISLDALDAATRKVIGHESVLKRFKSNLVCHEGTTNVDKLLSDG